MLGWEWAAIGRWIRARALSDRGQVRTAALVVALAAWLWNSGPLVVVDRLDATIATQGFDYGRGPPWATDEQRAAIKSAGRSLYSLSVAVMLVALPGLLVPESKVGFAGALAVVSLLQLGFALHLVGEAWDFREYVDQQIARWMRLGGDPAPAPLPFRVQHRFWIAVAACFGVLGWAGRSGWIHWRLLRAQNIVRVF